MTKFPSQFVGGNSFSHVFLPSKFVGRRFCFLQCFIPSLPHPLLVSKIVTNCLKFYHNCGLPNEGMGYID